MPLANDMSKRMDVARNKKEERDIMEQVALTECCEIPPRVVAGAEVGPLVRWEALCLPSRLIAVARELARPLAEPLGPRGAPGVDMKPNSQRRLL